ncbi:MAG: IPT/TIG domain-containing protein [Actinobacteria bacterium]|nr:IPT/TIG domain-containing protein [Actinomycetota bacterium]
MSVLKRNTRRRRHTGRRVAGVGVGVALIVLGLQAPAYAAIPTVAAFTPTAGPTGCVMQITGTNFNNPTADDVTIGTVSADFIVISDTEIWATVPGGAVNGPVTVHNATGTGSLDGFIAADDGGGCVPTVTSFAPTCGPGDPAGTGETRVTVTGTNLLQGVDTVDNVGVGADVDFAPYGGALGDPVSATLTEVVVDVPAAAAGTQPLRITTFNTTVGEGRVFSATQFAEGTCITEFSPTSGDVGTPVTVTGVGFDNVTAVNFFNGIPAVFTLTTNTNTTDTITTTVPFGAATGPITLFTPDASSGTPPQVQSADFTIGVVVTEHARNVTLKLKGALKLKGKVNVPDGFTECAAGVPVKLQKKKSGGGWKTLKTVTTSDTGAYSGTVNNKPGKYRALAPRTTAGDETCLKDASPVRTN